jgi:hypothetical protein
MVGDAMKSVSQEHGTEISPEQDCKSSQAGLVRLQTVYTQAAFFTESIGFYKIVSLLPAIEAASCILPTRLSR